MSGNLVLALTVFVLLALSAFFSGAETALFSLSRSTLTEMRTGSRRQRRVLHILEKPRMLLVTILFGNLLVNIANTSVVTAIAISMFGEKGVGYSMAFMTALILVFGEITPKSLALQKNRKLSPLLAGPLSVMMVVFTPVRLLLAWIADRTVEASSRLFGESEESYESSELATAVEMGHMEGL